MALHTRFRARKTAHIALALLCLFSCQISPPAARAALPTPIIDCIDVFACIKVEFEAHKRWMVETFFKKQILPALKSMGRQGITLDDQQIMARGMLMDADNQMDLQRRNEEKQADAYATYQPSQELCAVGTNVRSLASSEERSRANATALSGQSLSRQMGNTESSGAISPDADKEARWKQFTTTYCGVDNNNPDPANPQNSGLALACGAGATDKTRINKDIDYTRLIESPRTLDVNFQDAASTPDEEDVQAFLANAFPPLSRSLNGAMSTGDTTQSLNMGLRSIAARRGVAQNSFNAIIGMKSAGTSDDGKTREYLASIMKQLGVPEGEIYPMLGDKPSYYAQLEILGKRIYQTPGFYASLYDTPDNVERRAVALHAVDLMLDRALFESQLRREMAISVLLSSELNDSTSGVNRALSGGGG